MSIYVVEQGRRVATPLEALFPRTVQSVVRTARVDPVDEEASGAAMQQPATNPEVAAGISAYREQAQPALSRRQVKTAAEVMTAQPYCLAPDAMAADAWQLMHQRGFHHVLVAASDLTLLGMVSIRDIWELLAASANSVQPGTAQTAPDEAAHPADAMPLHDEMMTPVGMAALANTRIDTVMISQVVCTSAETSIRRVAEVMLLHKVDALPVTDTAQHVQGIVTRTDLLRALVLEAPLELWV